MQASDTTIAHGALRPLRRCGSEAFGGSVELKFLGSESLCRGYDGNIRFRLMPGDVINIPDSRARTLLLNMPEDWEIVKDSEPVDGKRPRKNKALKPSKNKGI